MTGLHRCWVEVSRARIAANFRAVREAVGAEIEVMPVVKADAYRHGAIEVSRVLLDEGARWLAVSNVEEGATLRMAGIAARILVMADFLPAERDALVEHELTPVIHSLDDLADWNRRAVRYGSALAYHLKIDSGMGRLGTRGSAAEIANAVLSHRAVSLEGLMTHFASAGDYASSQTREQMAQFEQVRRGLAQAGIQPRYVHLASTIPISYGRREAWGNMVRPGHAIYGYVSPPRGNAPEPVLRVAPALEWKTQVLAIKEIPAGAPVGYGAMFRAARPTRVAVLAAGYADGIPHRLSNRGQVIAAGKLTPIIGAVSMDLTTIDATDCPELQAGGTVTLLGGENGVSIDAQQIARVAGTISYSVLCGISARVKRIYV
ncbi:MAG: alanine racemase [Bryobacteraceae bacterium]